MSANRYRWSIETDAGFTTVTPVYGKNFGINVERVDNEVFYRTTPSGNLTFLRDDADLIINANIETEFTLHCEELDNPGTDFFTAKFTKHDCNLIDEDNRKVVVQPIPTDRYDNVIGGLEKEYNLIDLAPDITSLQYRKQPIFQVYIPGQNVLTCYLGGSYFELEVPSPPAEGLLFTDYEFGFFGNHGVVYGDGILIPDVSGEYTDETGSASLTAIRKSDGAYRLAFNGGTNKWEIRNASTATVLYEGVAGESAVETTFSSLTSTSVVYYRSTNVYARFITNQTTIGATPTNDIPDPDIVTNPTGYDKVIGIGQLPTEGTDGTTYEGVCIASAGASTTATPYDKVDDSAPLFDGQYFTKPTGAGTGAIYPLNQSAWTDVSFWFQYDSVLRDFQSDGAEDITIDHAYHIGDVISVLLGEIDSGITHDKTSTYSEYLYSDTTPLRTANRSIVITPKSNVLVGRYTNPASKALIKLSDVFNLLKNLYNAYWWIDDTNKLRIEHIDYFRKGGHYTTDQIDIDLTTALEPKTGKAWAYKTNKYNYDKATLPERIEYKWADSVTRPFEGLPIEVNSLYAEQGNIRQTNLSPFTSDIDFIQLQPADISKTGFVVAEGNVISDIVVSSFLTITVNGEEFKVQNGFVSVHYAQQNYLKHELPAASVKINGANTSATTVKRSKVQEIQYPSTSVDPMQLVTTSLGNGKIRRIEIPLSSRANKIELEHDN